MNQSGDQIGFGMLEFTATVMGWRFFEGESGEFVGKFCAMVSG